jgi:hypothetical protein
VACHSTRRVVWVQTSNQVRCKSGLPPSCWVTFMQYFKQYCHTQEQSTSHPAVCTLLSSLDCAQLFSRSLLGTLPLFYLSCRALWQRSNVKPPSAAANWAPNYPSLLRSLNLLVDLQAVFTASIEAGYDQVLSTPATAAVAKKWQELATFNTLNLQADGTITDADAKQVGGAAYSCRAFGSFHWQCSGARSCSSVPAHSRARMVDRSLVEHT